MYTNVYCWGKNLGLKGITDLSLQVEGQWINVRWTRYKKPDQFVKCLHWGGSIHNLKFKGYYNKIKICYKSKSYNLDKTL